MDAGKQAAKGQFLTFVVAGEEYALDILQVREIIEYDVVTRVPGTPPWVRGVINLRGSVVPVVDLAMKFGLPPSEVTKKSCIVIVDFKSEDRPATTGLLADQVSQVIELGEADITPPPTFGSRTHMEYLSGMARSGKKFALVLNIDRVLSAAELHATIRASAEATEEPTSPEPEPARDEPPAPTT